MFFMPEKEGADTKTSQVNAGEFMEYFRSILIQGKDILHVCLSSGLSGVVNSAETAKEALLEEFPDRKIFIVDSLGLLPVTDCLWTVWPTCGTKVRAWRKCTNGQRLTN